MQNFNHNACNHKLHLKSESLNRTVRWRHSKKNTLKNYAICKMQDFTLMCRNFDLGLGYIIVLDLKRAIAYAFSFTLKIITKVVLHQLKIFCEISCHSKAEEIFIKRNVQYFCIKYS